MSKTKIVKETTDYLEALEHIKQVGNQVKFKQPAGTYRVKCIEWWNEWEDEIHNKMWYTYAKGRRYSSFLSKEHFRQYVESPFERCAEKFGVTFILLEESE